MSTPESSELKAMEGTLEWDGRGWQVCLSPPENIKQGKEIYVRQVLPSEPNPSEPNPSEIDRKFKALVECVEILGKACRLYQSERDKALKEVEELREEIEKMKENEREQAEAYDREQTPERE